MEAVILAAGRSTRLYPLTLNKSKLLLPIAYTTSLGNNLEQLSLTKSVKDVVIVVGFCADQIEERFGSRFGGMNIHYALQKEQSGTGNALITAEKYLKGTGSFIVMGGDDLFKASDMLKLMRHRNSILVKSVDNVSAYGKIVTDGKLLTGIIEKPKEHGKGLVNTGCYVFSRSIFESIRKTGKSERGEYELTSALVLLSANEKVDVEQASFWQPVSYPWSLLAANEVLLSRMDGKKQKISPGAIIEKGAVIKGYVCIGKGTIIRSGAYIQGPCIIGENCSVGPNCSIRPFTKIGDNCKIGNAVEVKNSIILDNVSLSHLSNCSDSVIGENVKIGVGTVTANTRHDGATISSLINGKIVDSGLRKLGAVIGDGASTGVNTSIYPGSKIWPRKATNPGEIVTEDIV